ncbi:hypothetical protein K1T71_006629 [Dendrolimus kikuchii]|uniref:Uncharacterized protein n=1 Tax=Dendrolimus kikuchii TaxID=765133 RepID=A0ACC1D1P2_9NEOP|nr:hypothetical protein K1T71_006629 [Dendrolimus kikuchii]
MYLQDLQPVNSSLPDVQRLRRIKYATRQRYVTERIPILSTTHKPQPFFVSLLITIVSASEIEIYEFNGPLREKKISPHSRA